MLRTMRVTGVVATFCLAAIAHADETKGTIKTVDSERKEIVLKGLVKDSSYEISKDASIWLDGARAKLSDLSADDRAVIHYEKKGDRMVATMVRGLRKAQETIGTVNDVFGEKREITLKGTVKNTTYELIKDGTVWIDGKKSSLKDVRPGDEVVITYEQRGDRWVANDVTMLKRK